MCASDFRAWARESLRGKWPVAIGVGFVASLLTSGFSLDYQTGEGSETAGLLDFMSRDLLIMLTTVAIVLSLLALVIGGAVNLGWSSFHLNLINRREARFGDLFSQMHRLWAGFCMNFLMNLFISLWSLLLVIPGIIAAYRYAMMPFLMAEFPELGAMDAMRESKRLMQGNKWRLFCLEMSFLGWSLLSILTLGIGMLWLTPYMKAAHTAFYMEVTGRSQQQRIENAAPEF